MHSRRHAPPRRLHLHLRHPAPPYLPYPPTLYACSFVMGTKDFPCGPTDPSEVTPETLIYNGV